MAQIPYADLPRPVDPPLSALGADPLVELYCGDARCDCNVAALVLGGYPLLVDLGTGRVDCAVANRETVVTPAHQAAGQRLRGHLRADATLLPRLRDHYAATRRYGAREHYRYVSWIERPPRDPVPWAAVFRDQPARSWPLRFDPTGLDPTNVPTEGTLQLEDAYCCDRACDCRRVAFAVGGSVGGAPPRYMGVIHVGLDDGEPSAEKAEPGLAPNQFVMLVRTGLQQNPDLLPFYAERYRALRALMIPVIAEQRRRRSEGRDRPPGRDLGRNDLCPCGSGKKFKKCHGR